MDGAGDHFLAGAGFAFDEDGGLGIGDAGDEFEDLEHARAFAEHVLEAVLVEELEAQGGDLVLQASFSQGSFDEQADVFGVGWFGQEIVGAHAHGLNGVGNATVAGGDDDGDGELSLLDLFDEAETAEAWHSQVGQQHAIRTLIEQFECLRAVGLAVSTGILRASSINCL